MVEARFVIFYGLGLISLAVLFFVFARLVIGMVRKKTGMPRRYWGMKKQEEDKYIQMPEQEPQPEEKVSELLQAKEDNEKVHQSNK